ncbi:MAG TPA: DUF2993 domain-containing protein [Actinomycetota bacterium]|nr:DUF2993 domain-containing protein [Actinomycetota bacterium]
MRRLLVVAIVVGLLGAADYGAKAVAENSAAQAIDRRLPGSGPVAVDVHGFPFLLSAIRGHYEEIDVSTPMIRRDPVRFDDVRIRLLDVTLPLGDLIDGSGHASAATARGTAAITETSLEDALKTLNAGIDVSVSRDGIEVSSGSTGITIPADLELRDGALVLIAGGALGSLDLPLPSLAGNLDFGSTRTRDGRIVVTLEGRDVDLLKVQ